MTRFVVLQHTLPPGGDRPTHWDLMIECDGELLTWALDAYPELNSQVSALELDNHRLDYIEYEGPVSGGRGEVRRVESGICTILRRDARQLRGELRSQARQCLVEISRQAIHADGWEPASHVAADKHPGDRRCTVSILPLF